MPGEYFGRLIATGEWGVCLLSSCKVHCPQNKNIFEKSLKVKILSLDITYVMFFGVTVQEIDLLRGKNKFCKKYKLYVCNKRNEITLL